VIKIELGRIDLALDEQNQDVLDEALERVATRLQAPADLRVWLDEESADKSDPMPLQIFELLNHVVDKLHYSLKISADVGSNTQEKHERKAAQ
jgi:hypothetical protein